MAEKTSIPEDEATTPEAENIPTAEPAIIEPAVDETPETVERATAEVTEPSTPSTQPTQPVGATNGLAVAALVVGIVSIVSGWIPFWGVLAGGTAVVLGILGVRKTTFKGMAIAGIITGGIGALWGLLVSIFFVLAIVMSASGLSSVQEAIDKENYSQQSLIDSKKDYAKGETANFADKYELTVNSVENNFSPGERYVPTEGNQYVLINVTVSNISNQAEYISPYTFTILNNGLTKNPSYFPIDDELETGSLQAGESTTGNIVYEVSADASDLKLTYDTTVYQSSSSKKLVYTLAI